MLSGLGEFRVTEAFASRFGSLQCYKETDSPPQLDSDDAAMTYERFIRCGSAKPVANYYEAIRP